MTTCANNSCPHNHVWRSACKTNWLLEVLDTRPDGYHNIRTIFQELDLSDELRFDILEESACQITGFPDDIPSESNIVHHAWSALSRHCPGRVRGLRVHATKSIPAGGGLGGGSANAAVALRAINALYKLDLSLIDLERIGAELGSDVPFFIRGGCAVGTGRGEVLQPVETTVTFPLVVLFPQERVSTREAYRQLDRIPRKTKDDNYFAALLGALQTGDAGELGSLICNDFELVVAQTHWFQMCKSMLEGAGCLRAFLSGSGSTLIGLAQNEDSAVRVVQQLQQATECRVFVTRSTLSANSL